MKDRISKSISTSLFGLVLAGGKSSRMKIDKASLIYHGKTQAEYCYQLLLEFCQKVFLSNRVDQSDGKGHKGLPQIHDKKKYMDIGPLGGILSAMEAYPKGAWLVLACDLPYVNKSTLSFLIKNRNQNKLATAFLSRLDELPEPLCAIYETQIRSHLYEFLKSGITCPRKILLNSDVHLLKPRDKISLENINHPGEYEKVMRTIGKFNKKNRHSI